MKLTFRKTSRAFTLVELIVVITILAILGTIAFVSFQGFSTDARDSQRINDISVIEKGFSIHRTKDKSLPLPDENIIITASGSILGYQGTVGTGVLAEIGQAGNIIDPLDGSQYSYFRDTNGKYFQLLGLMEKKDLIIGTGDNTEARFPKTQGKGLGILRNNTLKEPLELAYVGTDFDVFQNTDFYKSYLADSSIFSSSGSTLGSFMVLRSKIREPYEADPNLVGILDYNIAEEFISPSALITENIGNPVAVDGSVKCDGSSTLRYGSGSDVLGGSDEFTIFVSYTIEELNNSSTLYPLVISSWGVSSGYNIACQHNLADINNPSLACYVDIDNGAGSVVPILGRQDIEYGVKQEVLMTGKGGVGRVYFNGEKVTEVAYTGTINISRGEGLGICSRSTTGHSLDGVVHKVYLSDVGLEGEGNINAFLKQLTQ